MLFDLILDQYTKPSEDVATTANVLDMFECKKEAEMLKCKFSFALMTIYNIRVTALCSYCLFGFAIGV